MRVTERTLYQFIDRVFGKFGWHCFPETGLDERFPDLILEGDGAKVVSEVKIDSEVQLIRAIVDADEKARRLGTRNAVALLFPRYVREISLSELERSFPRLRVSALFLTDWLTDRKELTLEELAELFTVSFKDWLQTRRVRVSYDLVVEAARNSIREIAARLRLQLVRKPVFDSVMAVVGRFDIYKNLLEDFSGISEDEARLYVADITAYILVNQLLFYHIIAERLGYEKLPEVSPVSPPDDFLEVLDDIFEEARKVYPHILGFNLFPLLVKHKDYRVVCSVASFVSALRALRPQHIREDLFGRLYHETIPPETRKNLGAFYTKPEAARLLASLAIGRWDAKVLDPACGSGTLLVEAYHRKMQLAPPSLSKAELHRRFLREDIYGIDIMHFASHMSSMNLTAQNIEVGLKPHVLSQDGIKTMIESVKEESVADDPPKTAEQPLTRWLEAMKEERIPKDFDVVIMNPPFTRRERIPAKKEELEKLVSEVKGKTGYWAYFVVAADKLLKEKGTMAIVIPEEFFVGRGAQSVREYLTKKGYGIKYVIRSGAEIAFSESAHYRDYLIVLQRYFKGPTTLTILNKKLIEIKGNLEKITAELRRFSQSIDTKLQTDEFTCAKISVKYFLEKHFRNLKPLVGFNTFACQTIALELLEEIASRPTLSELSEKELLKIRLYRPGQYRAKGAEKYAEKLFVSRYGARSPNVTFLLDKSYQNVVRLLPKKANLFFEVPLNSTILSLRTYSGVRHLDITSEEEFAITDANAIPKHILKISGMLPEEQVKRACYDIKSAYDNFAGHILLARRIRLTSPNAFWLSFYSDNKILGSQLPSIQLIDGPRAKVLSLYINSIIVLLQLLSFAAETEGAWVGLDHERVWSNIHIPEINKIKRKLLKKALSVFEKVHKINVRPLFERVKAHDPIQREIDELALEMLGLNHWKPRLDEIYNAVAKELETMHKILETSRKQPKKQKKKKQKEKSETETLQKWFKA